MEKTIGESLTEVPARHAEEFLRTEKIESTSSYSAIESKPERQRSQNRQRHYPARENPGGQSVAGQTYPGKHQEQQTFRHPDPQTPRLRRRQCKPKQDP